MCNIIVYIHIGCAFNMMKCVDNKKPKEKQFSNVYYIVQTSPIMHTCGFTFSLARAKNLAKLVYQQTGEPGKIITFSRDELQELGY